MAGEAPHRQLTLSVALPGVASIADLALEISDDAVHLHGAVAGLDHPFS